MAVPHDDEAQDTPLSERLLDIFVFLPAGLMASAVDEFPKLAARGREHLGVRVSSARAVGKFAVKAGQSEFRRRSAALRRRDQGTSEVLGDQEPEAPAGRPLSDRGPRAAEAHQAAKSDSRASSVKVPFSAAPAPATSNGHIPAASTLAIPGFDSLSASQVVQRLDGLNRQELVSVRAYEACTRGRRTIISRVDQLLDERS